jgi:TonB-linked SusC/RagA family outer membrane protein
MKRILAFAFLLMTCTLLSAQTMQITGTVTSSDDGTHMSGVSVVVKGTTKGTLTDVDGKFAIPVVKGETLVFSFIGYKITEMVINSSEALNITLSPDLIKMDEVIVVAYGTSTKSTFTGSAQKVSSDQLMASRNESVDKALAGKVTGVRITSITGDPGSSGDIQIRGIGSITGATSPLYIIDGVPMLTGNFGSSEISSNVLSSLNPQDIESITVLKDAAAASLYGSRAANGVVIITTKKGKEGDTKFTVSTKFGFSNIATNSYEQMTGPEYIEYARDALEGYRLNYLGALVPGQPNYGNTTIGQAAKDWAEANLVTMGKVIDPDVSTDWRKAIYGTGMDQEYQFSAVWGDEKTKGYVGLGYKNVRGIVAMNTFKRYNGTINIENKTRKWLDLSFSSILSYSDQTGRMDQSDQVQGIGTASPLGLIMAGNPTSTIYNDDGSLNMNASFSTVVKNPLYAIKPSQSSTSNQTYRAIMNGVVSVKITDFLTLKSTNALDYISVIGLRKWSPTSIDGESLNGLGERPTSSTSQITSSNLLVFDKKFGKHSINALGGFEAQVYNSLSIFTSASNYSTDKLEELGVGQPRSASSSKFGRFLQSYISSINYNYNDKYYLAGSMRMDESSQLGLDNRRAIFYSGSASWRFAKEEFLKTNWLTDGKLRFSFGTNGNLPSGSYAHLGLYDFGGIYGSESAIWISQPENKNLGWEMSQNMNIGMDFTLFDKVSMSVEYFNKYTKKLLLEVPTSYLTGFETATQNSGEISNKGVEVEFHFMDILNGPFLWNIDLSLSTLKATVEKLPGGNDIVTGDGNNYIYREGSDLYTFYLPVWHDVDPECGLARFLIDPAQPATTANLTYYYANAARGPVAKAYPGIMGGFTNNLSYKGFAVSALTTYQFGGNMFDYPGYFSKNHGFRFGTWNWSHELAGNYWKAPGDVVKYPRPVRQSTLRADKWSTANILSTDFIRLKEVSLQYSLPESLLSKTGIKGLTLSASASNIIFLYQAEKNVDPEVSLNGYRTVDTPLARTISFGLSLNF